LTSGEKIHRQSDMHPAPDDAVRLAVRDTNRYKIGDVAALVGMSSESIRYYEREGIISPRTKPSFRLSLLQRVGHQCAY